MNEMTIIALILFIPLLGGIIAFAMRKHQGIIGTGAISLSFLLSVMLIFRLVDPITFRWEWLPGFEVGLLIDKVSGVMILLVTLISGLVHLFGVDYMRNDSGIGRFYAKLGFFVFAMIGLLVADHLILFFVFWELVGLASYLLIGFWYSKEGIPQSARTTFMVNRVADTALLAGLLLVYHQTGDLYISEIAKPLMILPSLLIALGAFGKSAQLPFSGWLTKAMVGPTPVSALIHAATMVAAGVYLLYRVIPAFSQDIMVFVAITGAVTALYGGISALTQHDIKKILAYSTISQLGYMMIGIGVGARDASLLHLLTHAFFKAGLFLSAASIIHYLHHVTKADAQDMRNMGGLKSRLPWTYRSFLVCALALAGIPLFSGFISKEGIIIAAWEWAGELGNWAYVVPDLALIAAFLTAFYIGRVLFLVFWGEERIKFESEWQSESGFIKIPLIILALGSLWIVFNWNPLAHESWIGKLWNSVHLESSAFASGIVSTLSILLAASALVFSYSYFKPGTGYVQEYATMREPSSLGGRLIYKAFYLTELYKTTGVFVKRIADLTAWIDKRILDRILHFLAIGSVVFSKALALIDRFVIDGPVNLVAHTSKFIGRRFAGLSSRDSQTQLIWLIVILILILGFIILF